MNSQLQQAFHPFAQNSRGRFIFISDIQVSSLHVLTCAHADRKRCTHVSMARLVFSSHLLCRA